jgi:lysophospholipase L1-like esterase
MPGLVASLATIALAPVLAVQGVRVRRGTPRLPGASGPTEGTAAGTGPRLRLLVFGESTVDGVGAADHEEALTGQLAAAVAAVTGRQVRWRAAGRTGADARLLRERLLDRATAEPADVVVIALGVNDTLALHSPGRYRRDLLRLVIALRRRLGPVPIVLAGVPPMERFPVLPQPLRAVLGLRAHALDAAAAALAVLPGVRHAPMPLDEIPPDAFAADGFHPGPTAYRIWASQLARHVQ